MEEWRWQWRLVLLACIAAAAGCRCEEEVIAFADAPEGVVWAIQLSDIHVSVYHPNRAKDLETLGSTLLGHVRPALVFVTGDLTDAKNRDLTVTRQDEAEWIQYRKSMNHVIKESRLPGRVFFDLRGNHDKFGVPYTNSKLDFFSRYSINAQINRTDPVQAVTVVVPGGWKYLFLGFDDTISIGLRGPTNLFGHPSDQMLLKMESLLENFSIDSPDRAAKVIFGHFPMSFTSSTESGKRLEEVFARQNISAYLCGHLHTKFGKQLYKLHSYSDKAMSRRHEFWEWEMGDWRGSRKVRILSIDHGHTAFLDTSLDSLRNASTLILPTYPLDSRFMKKSPAYIGYDEDHGDSIRALVFSKDPVVGAVAKIFDSKSGALTVVDELRMQPVWKHKSVTLYQTSWRKHRYSDPSPLRYWVEIMVTDSAGRQTASDRRPFSVDGRIAQMKWGLSEFLIMGIRWADAYPLLFWFSIALLVGGLLLPKLACLYLERKRSYKSFVVSVVTRDGSRSKFLFKALAWVFMEGSRNVGLWFGQVAWVAWLLFLPWFWGFPLGDGATPGYLTYKGWQLEGITTGAPDVMVVVLPFLYMVVLPLTVVIACMSAERSACEVDYTLHWKKRKQGNGTNNPAAAPRKKLSVDKVDSGLLQLLEREVQNRTAAAPEKSVCWICSRWTRKVLIVGCLAIGWLHWRQCYWIAAAYGSRWVLASPAFAWSVPLLIALAAYETSCIRQA